MVARYVDMGHGMTVRVNHFLKVFPYPKQALALALCQDGYDVLYGGAAGGGKTDCLLMAALQYADVPGYTAGIVRRTYKQLAGPDGIIARSHAWGLKDKGALWNDNRATWTFPSGAKLYFGHLDHAKHQDNWQGQEFQFIGTDEGTQWADEALCSYPRTRLRRNESVTAYGVPLRQMMTANPGGPGHAWVKRRYITHPGAQQRYVPARVSDNYSMDAAEYDAILRTQGEVTYRRLALGDWDVEQGELFQRDWFQIIPRAPRGLRWVHYIDPAASEKKRADQTASGFVGVDDAGNIYLDDIVGWRAEWPESHKRIRARALARPCPVGFEAVAGFKTAASTLQADPELVHISIRATRPDRDKYARALPLATRAEQGRVFLVDGPWVDAWIDQALGFPGGSHDDLVDVATGGLHMLGGAGVAGQRVAVPPPPQRREVVF